ncbi:MAG TPA: helix-turn-helix transcriptional regulator [Clostridiaceae bacterium]
MKRDSKENYELWARQKIANIEGGKLLKQLRNNDSNLTLKDVGAILGISLQYISELERGIKTPSDILIRELSECYHTNDYALSKTYNRVPLSASEFLEENIELQVLLSKLSVMTDRENIIKEFVSIVG